MADDDDVQNARLVLQRAADYHGRLQSIARTTDPEDLYQTVEMEAEWTVLRIALVRAPFCHNKMVQLTSSPGMEGKPARCRRAPIRPGK